MNEHIFQSYIDNITQYYGISQEYIFSDGKQYSKTEPRQLFFYLCHKKGIPVVSVQSFIKKQNNFDMHHSNILRGINKMREKIESDTDYISLIKRLETVREHV